MSAVATAVRERPILFSGEMVRAILDGRKTQTRRVLSPQPDEEYSRLTVGTYHPTVIRRGEEEPGAETFGAYSIDGSFALPCRYGQPGDRLWVRETWSIGRPAITSGPSAGCGFIPKLSRRPSPMTVEDYRAAHPDYKLAYAASWDGPDMPPMRPSIHMPRWASRILLELTSVHVERVQDITEEEAKAEGLEQDTSDLARYGPYKSAFAFLWQKLNGPRGYGWQQNPLVWVLTFTPVAVSPHPDQTSAPR